MACNGNSGKTILNFQTGTLTHSQGIFTLAFYRKWSNFRAKSIE